MTSKLNPGATFLCCEASHWLYFSEHSLLLSRRRFFKVSRSEPHRRKLSGLVKIFGGNAESGRLDSNLG